MSSSGVIFLNNSPIHMIKVANAWHDKSHGNMCVDWNHPDMPFESNTLKLNRN